MKNLAALLFFGFLIQSCHNAGLIKPVQETKAVSGELPADSDTSADSGSGNSTGDDSGDTDSEDDGDTTTEKDLDKKQEVYESLLSKLSSEYLTTANDSEIIRPVEHLIESTREEVHAVEDAQALLGNGNFSLSMIKFKNLEEIDLLDTKLNDMEITAEEKVELLTDMVIGNAFYQCAELDKDLEVISTQNLDELVKGNNEAYIEGLIELKAAEISKKYTADNNAIFITPYISKGEDGSLSLSVKSTHSSAKPTWNHLIKENDNKFSPESFAQLVKAAILNGKSCIK